MASDITEFHKLEYVSLRTEIIETMNQSDRTIYFALAAGGLVATWLSTNQGKLPNYFWSLPLFIVLISYSIMRGKAAQIKRVGAYLSKIENRYADPALGGWEHDIRTRSPNKMGGLANRSLWFVYFAVAALFAAQPFLKAG